MIKEESFFRNAMLRKATGQVNGLTYCLHDSKLDKCMFFLYKGDDIVGYEELNDKGEFLTKRDYLKQVDKALDELHQKYIGD